ncbi:ABC transporter permease [Rhodovulum euryhalinum]|uniref:Putative thiamine transport system permease protein n=1 Tax=Rhodovulum euryhalinum TaxID=35805 RepID=A0A4R2KIW4_9RHOB|nr:ABC transporter permease subunit [Rhodovulum euryhalinum]TCO72347.1 putative thiamine transport system permease protein [Rhodovulum euryhalinum]
MRPLRAAPLLTLLVMLGPVAAGLLGTLAPALGLFPALGGTGPSPAPFAALAAWPGLPGAVGLSVTTGLAATVLSLVLVTLTVAGWQGTRVMAALERALSPLLSVPHAAAAFGLAFLIAPSGWIARGLSPWATGWERPPDLLIVQDPWGLAMVAGLVAKEVPFLLLMTLAALPQAQPARRLTIARSLGYGRVTGWLKAVFPSVYAQVRLPVYAVLAYSMTVVDVAIILGPATPPPLSVQVVRWMADPDLTLRLPAAAGAVLQLGLVLAALGLWRLGEIGAGRLGRAWAEGGARRHGDGVARALGLGLAALSAGAVIAGLAGLGLWSVAGLWPFPDALPAGMSLTGWARHAPGLAAPALDTVWIAGAATALALALALACLEAEHRFGLSPGARSLWLLYLPLLVPQVAFLPGLQTFALVAGVDAGMGAVILGHLVFVLPYVFLSLAAPWRAWDARHATVAAALGAGPGAVFWRVRLPMLLAPVLTAAAVGFAVSVGQYLPTLLIGGGRVQTLTTEAVALASGGDRRAIGVAALMQTGVVVAGFALALTVPRLAWANRRGMRAA